MADTEIYDGPQAICFAEGTMIATRDGEIAVEELAPEHVVQTADGRHVSVRWVGRQSFGAGASPMQGLTLVEIAAGALGEGCPARDLRVTADHGMILDGMVVTAGSLVNGGTICEVAKTELPKQVSVYHVETEAHEAILANGAPAESFVDAGARRDFDNGAEYVARFGAERIIPEMALPRITSARLLPAELRARLGISDEGFALSA